MEDRNLLIWVLAIVVFLFLFEGIGMMGLGSNNYGYSGMMGMMYGGYGLGMMFFGWIYGVLIFVALVLLILWLFQQVQNKKRR